MYIETAESWIYFNFSKPGAVVSNTSYFFYGRVYHYISKKKPEVLCWSLLSKILTCIQRFLFEDYIYGTWILGTIKRAVSMRLKKKPYTLEEIKQTDLIDYLASLGYLPAKLSGSNYWYPSPLRLENIASFKVNWNLNRWFDYELGKGGILIDLGMLYHRCPIGDFVMMFQSDAPQIPPQPVQLPQRSLNIPEESIIILKVKPLFSTSLLHYLSKRKVPISIADSFCREVVYRLLGKEYYAIGFPNDPGGYELRNPCTKLSSSPNDITSIDNGKEAVAVFEAFFDLLSFLAAKGSRQADRIILSYSIHCPYLKEPVFVWRLIRRFTFTWTGMLRAFAKPGKRLLYRTGM